MKKFTSRFFVKLFFALILFLLISCVSFPWFDDGRINYKMTKTESTANYLVSSLRYPEFDSNDDLNNLIRAAVISPYKSFAKVSKEDWEELCAIRNNKKLAPFSYIVNCTISETVDFLSILINTEIYDGGAHGNISLKSYTYDKKKKKFVTIRDVCPYSYSELSKLCREQLVKKIVYDNNSVDDLYEIKDLTKFIEDGTRANPASFENFMVYKDKIEIYFEPYAVAPFSFGIQKVQIKNKNL